METWKRRFIRDLFPYSRSRMHTELAYRAKQPHVPKRLYKYRTFSKRDKESLEKGVLWLSSPKNFNDPYDSAVHFHPERFLVEDESVPQLLAKYESAISNNEPTWRPDPIERPIEGIALRNKILNDLKAGIPEELMPGLLRALDNFTRDQAENMRRLMSISSRSDYSILCLTENATSVLMWSHYADKHRGFCIEYDLHSLSPDDKRRQECYPVFYRRKLTDATRYMGGRDPRDVNHLHGVYLCLLKSDEWAYEREWRIIFLKGEAEANFPLPMPQPSAIILGAHVSPKNEGWANRFSRREGIALKKVVQRHSEFRLEIRDHCNGR